MKDPNDDLTLCLIQAIDNLKETVALIQDAQYWRNKEREVAKITLPKEEAK